MVDIVVLEKYSLVIHVVLESAFKFPTSKTFSPRRSLVTAQHLFTTMTQTVWSWQHRQDTMMRGWETGQPELRALISTAKIAEKTNKTMMVNGRTGAWTVPVMMNETKTKDRSQQAITQPVEKKSRTGAVLPCGLRSSSCSRSGGSQEKTNNFSGKETVEKGLIMVNEVGRHGWRQSKLKRTMGLR